MSIEKRVLIAIGLLFFDLVIFVVPLVACVVACIIIARPDWFKVWVDKLYAGKKSEQQS